MFAPMEGGAQPLQPAQPVQEPLPEAQASQQLPQASEQAYEPLPSAAAPALQEDDDDLIEISHHDEVSHMPRQSQNGYTQPADGQAFQSLTPDPYGDQLPSQQLGVDPMSASLADEQPLVQTDEQLYGRTAKVGRGSRLRLWITIGAFVVAAIALAVILLRDGTSSNTNRTNLTSNINQVVPVETPTANSNSNTNTTAPAIQEDRIDSDGDGLTDEEEKELGTKINDLDSDNDGLTDRQEVRIYETNPRDSDSDNDGFSDGDEVRNFYDPNGPGKLLDTVEEINKTDESTDDSEEQSEEESTDEESEQDEE